MYIVKKLFLGYNRRTMSVTYQPKNKKRFTTHGFLVRMATKAGAKIIQARRAYGRAKLAVVKGGKNFTR